MKIVVLLSALLLGSSTTAFAADPISPDIVQIQASATFAAGEASTSNINVLTTPSNKRFVIQTVSFYTDSAVAGSSTQVFIATNIFNNVNFWSLPTVYADGTAYPSTTLSATYYAGAGTTVSFNAYRTGSLTYPEYVYVFFSGYYVQKP